MSKKPTKQEIERQRTQKHRNEKNTDKGTNKQKDRKVGRQTDKII